ncbi:MAG TPA: hypothetical protein GXZ69_03315 [Spirochaetales bacterium]|nr:hypothetical protein [Spirochaetales bacterium]
MKKRFLVSLIVVCVLIPATLSAAMVNLSIGATARYDKSFEEVQSFIDNDTYGEELGKIENYAFGADIRLKILLAEIDLVGMFGKETVNSIDYTSISVLTSAGISLDILNIARLGFGMGPRFNVLIDSDGNAALKDSTGNDVDSLDGFGDAFIKSPVAYRATADIKLGSMMLGLNYTVDTSYTFENWERVQDLFDAPLNSGKVGVSFLFSLI